MDRRSLKSLGLLFLATTLQGCNCAHSRQSVYPNSSSAPVEVQAEGIVVGQGPLLEMQAPRKTLPGSTSVDVPMLTH